MTPTDAPRGSENGNRFPPTGREMRTISGLLIDLSNPQPEQMRMVDIATGLAHTERFGGHNPRRPTVAQHSLAVELIASRLYRQQSQRALPMLLELNASFEPPAMLRRAALMHDAAEAYVGDLIGGLKKNLRGTLSRSVFDVAEDRFAFAIERRFSCAPGGWATLVHDADCLACAYEMMGWGESDHAVPDWLPGLPGLARCYRRRGGGKRAFLKRATELGLA